MYDHIDFASFNDVVVMDNIYSVPYFDYFGLWSEFHARYSGFKHTQEFWYGTNLYDGLRSDAPKLCEMMIQQYSQKQTLYELMQLIGRYIFLEECCSSFIPSFTSLLKKSKGVSVTTDLKKIYQFIKNHQTVESILPNISEFANLVIQIE